jgi:LysR family cys regulon transcriptional activator
MKLQQLRYVLEIARHGNHLSAAAKALHTSQPGVSRQIQLLEAELGFEIFLRTRNRIIGLTEPGREVLAIAKRLATDMSALRALKEDINASNRGTLTIATTHTQARYVLPNVIRTFVGAYPEVRLVLKQGDPEEICALVDSGDADLAIGTETIRSFPDLVKLECYKLERSVVAKIGHPILEVEPLTLQAIAAYPIITYGPRYSGRWKVMKAFKDAGIEPKFILSAIDADVSKTYVELGLGIAILTTITVEPMRDAGIRARDAKHLFESSTVAITLRSNTYVRPFILDFIRATAAHLTPAVVREALRNGSRREDVGTV